MTQNLYTRDEIVLCTYAARFDGRDIGGVETIRLLRGRSTPSVTAKIQNIAAMLDEHGIPRESRIAALTGRPAGESGRRTNWAWIEPLVRVSRAELLDQCRGILTAHPQEAEGSRLTEP